MSIGGGGKAPSILRSSVLGCDWLASISPSAYKIEIGVGPSAGLYLVTKRQIISLLKIEMFTNLNVIFLFDLSCHGPNTEHKRH